MFVFFNVEGCAGPDGEPKEVMPQLLNSSSVSVRLRLYICIS